MVDGIMRTIFVFRPVVQEEMSFKDISYLLALVALFLGGAEQFVHFGTGHYGKYSCERMLTIREFKFIYIKIADSICLVSVPAFY